MEKQEVIIRHLMDSTFSLNENDMFTVILKSHLLTQCLEMSMYRYKLPNNVFGSNIRCKNCCTAWEDGKFISKTVKNKITKSAKRRYKSLIKNEFKTQQEKIEAKEKLCRSKLIIKCTVCSICTEIPLHNKNTTTKSNVKKNKNAKEANIVIQDISNENKPVIKIKSIKKDKRTLNKIKTPFYQSMNKKTEVITPQINKDNIPKVQNKNKRNKNKFAGLCEIACNASKLAKTEPNIKSNNPLHLLLKGKDL